MPAAEGEYRLYRDLASWWPLISPPGEYEQEAAYLTEVLKSAAAVQVHEVLDLGSGGGQQVFRRSDSRRGSDRAGRHQPAGYRAYPPPVAARAHRRPRLADAR